MRLSLTDHVSGGFCADRIRGLFRRQDGSDSGGV